MPCETITFADWQVSGMTFRRCTPEPEVDPAPAFDATLLAVGFALQSAPFLSPTSGTDDALQVQEYVVLPHEGDATLRRAFWSGWKEADATPSGIWTGVVPRETPWVISDKTQIITSAAASTATSGAVTSLRLTGAEKDGETYNLFIGSATVGDCYLATYSAGSVTLPSAPYLTQSGQGRADAGPVSLACPVRNGSDLYVIYAVNAATTNSAYWVAKRTGPTTWTKIGISTILTPTPHDPEGDPPVTSTDGDGLEYHSAYVLGGEGEVPKRIALLYEAFSGASNGNNWGVHLALSPVITDDFEGVLVDAFSKSGRIISHSGGTGWAQRHIATGSLYLAPSGAAHAFVQGSSWNGNATGNGGPWELGRGTLNP